jgi:Cof subfamily protein (haloacid dehalogenase superfamily)
VPPRLLAIDLDGTLFNSRQQISQRNVAALARARRAGVEICIATGRRHTFAWRSIAALVLEAGDVIISSNGAVVRQRDGLLLQRTELAHEHSLALCELAGEHRERLVFTFDRVDQAPEADCHPGSLLMESSTALHAVAPRWIDENRADIVEMVPLENGLRDQLASQAMACGGVGPMQRLHQRLEQAGVAQHLALYRTEYPARDFSFLDVLPQGASKGAALARLAALRGFTREQVAAIGDNFNDEDMLEYAGHSYITANGAPEMVAAAPARGWRVAPANDADGAAVAVDELLAAVYPGG